MAVFRRAVAAGGMIGVGATIYLACENKVVGAVLFSIGLFLICAFEMYLFTGKIGYIIQTKNHPNCLVIWAGNFVGSIAVSAMIRIAKPKIHDAAYQLVSAKLEQNLVSVMLLSFMCGILMYLAVDNFASHPHEISGIIGIVLCVSVFILCGFEHSIADMNYCVLAVETFKQAIESLVFLVIVSVCNGLGALAIRRLVRK